MRPPATLGDVRRRANRACVPGRRPKNVRGGRLGLFPRASHGHGRDLSRGGGAGASGAWSPPQESSPMPAARPPRSGCRIRSSRPPGRGVRENEIPPWQSRTPRAGGSPQQAAVRIGQLGAHRRRLAAGQEAPRSAAPASGGGRRPRRWRDPSSGSPPRSATKASAAASSCAARAVTRAMSRSMRRIESVSPVMGRP